jgi:hypothetical protein
MSTQLPCLRPESALSRGKRRRTAYRPRPYGTRSARLAMSGSRENSQARAYVFATLAAISHNRLGTDLDLLLRNLVKVHGWPAVYRIGRPCHVGRFGRGGRCPGAAVAKWLAGENRAKKRCRPGPPTCPRQARFFSLDWPSSPASVRTHRARGSRSAAALPRRENSASSAV